MHCSACGAEAPDGTARCPNCGAPLQALSPSGPSSLDPPGEIKSHMAWAILAAIFCCLPFGIVAIVQASKVGKRLEAGDTAGAWQASKSARMWVLISLSGLALYFILGIMAAIAIPQFVTYRQRAFDAAAKAELKNMAIAQEEYFMEHHAYTDKIEDLAAYYYQPSPSVTISIQWANDTGWAAQAQHFQSDRPWVYDSTSNEIQD